MNLRKCFLIIILCSSLTGSSTALEAPEQISVAPCTQKTLRIKVLLDEQPMHSQKQWQISSSHDITIADPEAPGKKINLHTHDLSIRVHEGYFFLNKHRMKSKKVLIIPTKGTLSFQGKTYPGSLLLTLQDDKQYLVNVVELEEYVYCVLKTESWPGWPLEVNKVFAIACRSYAMAMVVRSAKLKTALPYHIKNSNSHQTYTGLHSNAVLQEAVEQTKGVFLAYNNQPIIAMFDCCCGGVIPARIAGFDFQKAPYLSRDYPCTFCKTCKIYNWKAEFAIKELEHVFHKTLHSGQRLKEFRVIKNDKAGLVEEVILRSGRKSNTLSGKQLYSLLDEVKSYCFTIRRRGSMITINGRGYGHHIGLCQWGARQMVNDGWDYQSVLQFYYPGTFQAKLNLGRVAL